jgi:DNA-binding NarL/FixJ family response regulator
MGEISALLSSQHSDHRRDGFVTPSRIFIVDDHPLVREWLTALIEQRPDLMICGEAGDLDSALRGITYSKPDLVIIELSLGRNTGFELIRTLKLRSPSVVTVVLSMHDEHAYAERAIRAGARGYIVKRETTKNIVDAIELVLRGNIYLSHELREPVAEGLMLDPYHADDPPIHKLSYRELEVFQFIGKGYNRREIAEQLKVNTKTIQTFCSRMREKLGLGSSAELVREAMRWNGTKLLR